MSAGLPSEFRPMLREKNGLPFSKLGREMLDARKPPPASLPNSNTSESLKKNVLFSGKNRLNLERSTCRSSTSVAEKSVFRVADILSEGVIRYERSRDGCSSLDSSSISGM